MAAQRISEAEIHQRFVKIRRVARQQLANSGSSESADFIENLSAFIPDSFKDCHKHDKEVTVLYKAGAYIIYHRRRKKEFSSFSKEEWLGERPHGKLKIVGKMRELIPERIVDRFVTRYRYCCLSDLTPLLQATRSYILQLTKQNMEEEFGGETINQTWKSWYIQIEAERLGFIKIMQVQSKSSKTTESELGSQERDSSEGKKTAKRLPSVVSRDCDDSDSMLDMSHNIKRLKHRQDPVQPTGLMRNTPIEPEAVKPALRLEQIFTPTPVVRSFSDPGEPVPKVIESIQEKNVPPKPEMASSKVLTGSSQPYQAIENFSNQIQERFKDFLRANQHLFPDVSAKLLEKDLALQQARAEIEVLKNRVHDREKVMQENKNLKAMLASIRSTLGSAAMESA